jgi:uncharacterized protein YdhG (YjbR/CyaY superfamily)
MSARPARRPTPTTIDEYLATVSDDKRAALERLRRIIRAAAPDAEEAISYRLPAFRLDGQWLVWFGAAANHCAIYGVGGVEGGALDAYDTSGRGTIRFPPDSPLPAALVRKLVQDRIAQNADRQKRSGRTARRKSST